ncbi:MAG: hypothetical protein ACYCVH_12370 [Ignavibacteriaceae bacterium]
MNFILLKPKTLGSAALRAGATAFGLKDCPRDCRFPSLFVSIFKTNSKANSFITFLSTRQPGGLNFFLRQVIYKDKTLFVVYVYCLVFITTTKIQFNNFRELCNSSAAQLYKSNTIHPNKQKPAPVNRVAVKPAANYLARLTTDDLIFLQQAQQRAENAEALGLTPWGKPNWYENNLLLTM